MDNFISTSLYGTLRNKSNVKGKPRYNQKANDNRRDGGKKKASRNKRKRYLYARCQEIFKECPKKLADVIVNNDLAYLEPARQPPEAREVKRLYEALWGRTGPINPIMPGSRAPELPLCDYFLPITVEEIGEKIKRIKNRIAAGSDVLLKENFHIPGLPIIIAKVFNILWYGSYFPIAWKENRTALIPKANKDGNKLEDWQPITIGPILGRIFSSIPEGRLRRGGYRPRY